MKKTLLIIGISVLTSGCISQVGIMSAISKYGSSASQIDLGDSKEKVLSILLPTQEDLGKSKRKSPEKFLMNGKRVDIYFFRSSWHSDGITTDDEFTPYTFINDELVAVGWSALGGAKTQGQAIPSNSYILNGPHLSRAEQQILNHGAGGCTPNFSTGGCL